MFRTWVPYLGASLLIASAACSDDDGSSELNNMTSVEPVAPTGYIAGEVWDIAEMPIAGAQVTVFGGGTLVTVSTDELGQFSVGSVAASAQLQVSIDAEGFVGMAQTVTLDDAAGNFPTNNAAAFIGPIQLFRATGTFTVDVADASAAPVSGAHVELVTQPSYLFDGGFRGEFAAIATTDAAGRASFSGLPAVRERDHYFIDVIVGAVDVDGDGVTDLEGTTQTLDDDELQAGRNHMIVVLDEARANEGLELLGSNLTGVVSGSGPAVVGASEGIRLLFNRPVDLDGVDVSLVDELGTTTVPTMVSAGMLAGAVQIDFASDPNPGTELNLRARVPAATGSAQAAVSASLFIEEAASQAVVASGTYVDANDNGSWGDGSDAIRITTNLPLGRASASSYTAEVWVELDLDASGTIGDATGELPVASSTYPTPLVLSSSEPTASNGAPNSGYTTVLAQRVLRLSTPLTDDSTRVTFRIAFPAERNGGEAVVTPSGKAATDFTGSLTLTRPAS